MTFRSRTYCSKKEFKNEMLKKGWEYHIKNEPDKVDYWIFYQDNGSRMIYGSKYYGSVCEDVTALVSCGFHPILFVLSKYGIIQVEPNVNNEFSKMPEKSYNSVIVEHY